MKIYQIGIEFHRKNLEGMNLAGVLPWKGETDGVIICNDLNLDLINRPDIQHLLLGPGVAFEEAVSFFRQYRGEKKLYFNALSLWNQHLFERYGPNPRVQYVSIPFPVDVDKFKPVYPKRRRFFVYFKDVHSRRLREMMDFLASRKELRGYEYTVFTYRQYYEDMYLDYIKQAEFGVWVGRHESQGFALEEALSCDCPLFVYDIQSMKDECVGDVRYSWKHFEGELPATAASYFDETCGIIVQNPGEFSEKFDQFRKMAPYNPRGFVTKNLTVKNFCEKIQGLFPGV